MTSTHPSPTPAVPVVEFRFLSKSYDHVDAVENVCFTVNRGRIAGLVGRNGAGKSTLMKCLLGLAAPSFGDALLWGRPFSEGDGRRVGAVLESMAPLPGVTPRRELAIWADALGVPSSRVDHVLHQVELDHAQDRKVKGFSTGMRQRLSLATALLTEPELLVLDEPTNGLDPEGVRWLRTFLRSFADAGGTVLISSHQLAELERTIDDVIVLERTVLFTGPVDDLIADDDLETRFFKLVHAQKAALS